MGQKKKGAFIHPGITRAAQNVGGKKSLHFQSRKEAQRRVAGVAVLPGKVTVVQVLADALHFRTIRAQVQEQTSGLSSTETNYDEGENNNYINIKKIGNATWIVKVASFH